MNSSILWIGILVVLILFFAVLMVIPNILTARTNDTYHPSLKYVGMSTADQWITNCVILGMCLILIIAALACRQMYGAYIGITATVMSLLGIYVMWIFYIQLPSTQAQARILPEKPQDDDEKTEKNDDVMAKMNKYLYKITKGKMINQQRALQIFGFIGIILMLLVGGMLASAGPSVSEDD